MTNEPSLMITQHIARRARQRGYRDGDLSLIAEFGEPAGDGIFLSRKSAERAVEMLAQERKQVRRLTGATLRLGPERSIPYPTDWSGEAEIVRRYGRQEDESTWHLGPMEAAGADRVFSRWIERLQRLAGTFVPVVGGWALSVYRPCRRRQRRLLRAALSGRSHTRNRRTRR